MASRKQRYLASQAHASASQQPAYQAGSGDELPAILNEVKQIRAMIQQFMSQMAGKVIAPWRPK